MSEYRVRIGRNGTKVHRANADGNTYCGSQRRGNQGKTFLPADTPVTCVKCGAEAQTVEVAPAPVADEKVYCENGHRVYDMEDFQKYGCARCEYGDS